MAKQFIAVTTVAALAITVVGLDACGADPGGDREPGPLRFTSDEFGMMLAPMDGPVFAAIHPCLDGDQAAEVTILDVAATEISGAEEVEFQIAWVEPEEVLELGAAPLDQLPDVYGAADGSGLVQLCDAGRPSTGLDLATILPQADGTAVVVDGIDVRYRVDDAEYDGHAEVVIGICAAEPVEPASEPEACQEP